MATVHLGPLVLPWLGPGYLRRSAGARLPGIRGRPLFASVTGIAFAVAAAALAGTLNAVTTGVYPTLGALTLIFAFASVIIGGLGSLWGRLPARAGRCFRVGYRVKGAP